jgi:DNA-binding CsgD family transcriptional regulator
MSWAGLPEETKAFLRETLTARQLECWRCRENGYGYQKTAERLGCSKENVRNILKAAELNILKVTRSDDPSGRP